MSRWHEKRPSENVINLAAALAGSLAAVASLALLSTRERRARVGLFKHGRELYIPSRSNTTAHSRHSGLIRLPCCALSSIRANHYRNEPPATASLSLPSSAPCGRSHCGDSDAGDADRIPRTNSTADLLANSTNSNSRPKHPEGPNIGPGSDDNWFQKGSELPPKTDLLHKGHSKGGKLLVVTVGLPGRGKTYIARKVARYLRWINYRTRAFSVARYRMEQCGAGLTSDFFDNTNEANVTKRKEVMTAAIEDIMQYLLRTGEVAIMDGTNFTRERRQMICDRVAQEDGFEILWIESICEDPKVLARNALELSESSPDYVDENDFQQRLEHYKAWYQTLDTSEGPYVKCYDGGSRIEIHAAQGFVPTKITSFLMNLHMEGRPVFISRHGESMFNTQGLIGGNPPLSPWGEEYADMLADFIDASDELATDELCVWSSTMKRAVQTAEGIRRKRYVMWRALREIEVGVCDGLTYAQVKQNFPREYASREKDKLRYRYPRGESYLDIIARLEPVIFEMERQKAPLLIIAHQAVLRCLYAYFLDLPSEEIPYLSIPLHTVIKLTPQAFGCSEKRYKLLDDTQSA